MPKFKPGDPVWVRPPPDRSCLLIKQESPATVISHWLRDTLRSGTVYGTRCHVCGGNDCYIIDIIPLQSYVCECILRPRRDDYQQHEGLGARDQLDKPLRETTVEDVMEVIHAGMVHWLDENAPST